MVSHPPVHGADGGQEPNPASGAHATAASLQHDSALQSEVATRLATLLQQPQDDDDYPGLPGKYSKSKKSGRAKTANDFVLCDVDWPHYYVYRGHQRKPAQYEELSIAEFVLGFSHMILKGKHEGASHAAMLQLLCNMMEDASEFGWPSVRNFYAILTNQVEMKRATWTDSLVIQHLRANYAQKYIRQNPNTKKPKSAPVCCTAFQDGSCEHPTDHTTDSGLERHICSYCFRVTGQHYNHAENQCRRKERHTKNGVTEGPALYH